MTSVYFLMMCLRHWEIKFSFILHISERTVLWIILNMLLVLFWILTPHQIIFLLWIWCSEFSQSQQWAFMSVYARGNAPWNWVFFTESAEDGIFFFFFFFYVKIWNCISWKQKQNKFHTQTSCQTSPFVEASHVSLEQHEVSNLSDITL